MIKDFTDEISKMPLEVLIDAGYLTEGETVYFNYTSSAGKEEIFKGTLDRNGIKVFGQTYSISYSAVYCMEKVGDQKAVNGWFAWQTEDGHYLAQVYQKYRGIQLDLPRSTKVSELFFQYPSLRDVIFIFGAGASYADGAPLQKDILPLILGTIDKEIRDARSFRIFRQFMEDNFALDVETGYCPSLEEVFGFLDYFIQKGESLNSKYSLWTIIEIKEALIKLTHYIVSSSTTSMGKLYRLFWETVYHYNTNISTITLNYDTYLEDAFFHMFPRNMFLDYCINLANYDHCDEINNKNWWVNPRLPILSLQSLEPIAIKIIKIHGSLNWKYCNCCNHILLTPLDKIVDLGIGDSSSESRLEDDVDDICTGLSGMRCSRDGNEFQTMLVPPSHLKDLSHPVNSQLFIEFAEEARRAKKIVFIGYSMPEADVHMKAILKKSLRPQAKMYVVDINTDDEFQNRFKALSQNVEFVPCSFEAFLANEDLLKEIFE